MAQKSLPPGWSSYTDASGRTYYANSSTGATQWDPPVAAPATPPVAVATPVPAPAPAVEPPLKQGWTEHKDPTGKTYYANISTGETSWDRPVQEPAKPVPVAAATPVPMVNAIVPTAAVAPLATATPVAPLPGTKPVIPGLSASRPAVATAVPVATATTATKGVTGTAGSSALTTAAKPAEAPLKPGWSAQKDPSGKTYYANITTGESSWDRPAVAPAAPPPAFAAASQLAEAVAATPASLAADAASRRLASALPTAAATPAAAVVPAAAASAPTGLSAAAKPASEPPLKPGWSEHKDASGKTYYANVGTGESSWDRPSQPPSAPLAPVPTAPALPVALGASRPAASLPTATAAAVAPVPTATAKPPDPPPLKAGWAEYTDPQGKTYYANLATGESSWDRPSDPGAAAAALLAAAAAASKPTVASAVAAPAATTSATRGRWSQENTYALGPEGCEHKFRDKATLLDKDRHNSVMATVGKLNAGLIPAEVGYCIMFSLTRQQYFLLWRSDKEQEAFMRLDIRDTGEQLHWTPSLAKPLGPKGSEHRFQGRALLLNTSIYNSVAGTVNELNSGRIRVDQGYCVIFSSSKAQYFLIYAQGKDYEAARF